MTKKDLITFRLAKESDLNFIFSTWVKGMASGTEYNALINRQQFVYHFGEFVKKRVLSPGILIMVAALKENEDVILGYSVVQRVKDKNALHWVYVKREWRRLGLMKDLLPSQIDFVTSMTKVGKKLKPKHIEYNPFI